MKKVGVQKFLNPVDSDDSGFVKLSIRPRKEDYTENENYIQVGQSVKWQMADCSDRIYLEFGYGMGLEVKDYATPVREVRKCLTRLRARRRKMQTLLDAVNKVGNAFLANMDKDEEMLLGYIDDKKEVEASRGA